MLEIQLLLLLFVANGSPVVARALFNDWFCYPLDGDQKFFDGQPLLGASKTIRGVLSSVVVTALVAMLAGFEWELGASVAILAMVGDVMSSFVKRRLKKPPSSQAIGLDQIPESLLPLIFLKSLLALSYTDILLLTMVFMLGSLLLSQLLYKLKIRNKPY